ncbi:RimJ/RimL family protein N-acetyltransferase [Novosphingobium sp. PhB165]|uniref:GNAT family N-acetyltransferase n=1 Tax=Novosphingobium sp. PhB165 TaxID=2485105 RepID=UPI0010440717|nr:GNAT family N-acetyltransferase [Novosphingobium sp. PhB165]TCM17300.1 RimJ/RimL family protein N-acetyltransferase [Novosphingobium sp. PhB165]
MFIRSERLFLRPGWPEDREEFLALIADESVVRNLSRAPWPYTADDARRFLDLPQDLLLPRLLVTQPGAAGARLLGCIGLSEMHGEVNLGYWIARDHWGQGFASEAARAMLSMARAIGHRRIVANHFIDNPASGRVLEKAGFARTGRIVERFSTGREMTYPAREYALEFDAPSDCDSDSDNRGVSPARMSPARQAPRRRAA